MASHGTRQTRQRTAILETFQDAGRPLSFEELAARARARCPGIGERTIFRNLKEMMEEMCLVRVYLPGQPARYELPTGENRPHFICRSCEAVFQLPMDTPEVMSQVNVPNGFHIEGEDIVFFGRCPDCK